MPPVSSVEILEPRIAPASVVSISGKSASWPDYDGDTVTVKWTGTGTPDFTHHHTSGSGLIMDEIILSGSRFTQDAITVSVKAAATGDGEVNLGYIDATGIALKSFSAPKASIREIDCGDAHSGIGTLALLSFGPLNLSAFTSPGGDLVSTIDGTIGAVKIAADMSWGELLLGHDLTTKVGTIHIGGDLTALNDSSSSSASIVVNSPLTSLTIGGSVIGGPNFDSGFISLMGDAKTISIGGDVRGGTSGDTGELSFAGFQSVKIGGSLIAGTVSSTGWILEGHGGSLTIGGNLVGGSKFAQGVVVLGDMTSITVKGSVMGGAVDLDANTASVALFGSGNILAGRVGKISIGHDLAAGTYANVVHGYTGAIVADSIGTLSIGGSVLGTAQSRAFILAIGTPPAGTKSYNALGAVSIHGSFEFGDIDAGLGDFNGSGGTVNQGNAINADAGIGSVTIGGNFLHSSILAGTNDLNAVGVGAPSNPASFDTQSTGDPNRHAILGAVTIKGGIYDDSTAPGYSGFEAEQITKISVGGDVVFKHGAVFRYFDPSDFVFAAELPLV